MPVERRYVSHDYPVTIVSDEWDSASPRSVAALTNTLGLRKGVRRIAADFDMGTSQPCGMTDWTARKNQSAVPVHADRSTHS